MQIEQVIGGVNGDTTAQAVQLRMRALGENFISGAELIVYDAAGNNPVTLITFDSAVGSGPRRILVTTSNFSNYEETPISADFIMTNTIPASYLAAGRLAYQMGTTVYWSVSWGGAGYTGPNTGTTDNDADGNFAPPFGGALPSNSMSALLFNGDSAALSTNNAADYSITPGAATFTNNNGDSTVLGSPPTPTPTPPPPSTPTPTPTAPPTTPTPTPASSPTPTPTPTPSPAATPTPMPTPSPTPGLVGNVATRLPVGTGDNVLIEGFIVLGPNGSTKKIMVRALGPFLIPFGIPDALPNPTLEIRDGNNALIATNNDWMNTQVGGIITADQAAEIHGSGLAPTNNLESAIIANLAPGGYTAVMRGVNNTVGTGIVDAYDMSAASPARLANIATRGLIQPGDQLMIAGFIIQQGDVRAVIRAIGPSLIAFGINNALSDTTLQLRDVNGAIVRENDDWQSHQKQELESTGLQPSDFREAAIVATIPPGQYTAQVRGKPETTGIGVVEVYFLQ
ncbi:MAG TPA: hypothetical protein VEX43_16090 [Chthoniobacterales bacterium]|nr:hypothetical protein [Chthoniobacterales bacterium]